MKKMVTISTVVSAALIACSGIAAAADYTINWQNKLGENSSCSLVQAQAYVAGSQVAEMKLPETLTNKAKNMKLTALTCTSMKLSASCSYPVSDGTANITPTLEVGCANGIATVSKPLGASSGGSITFVPFW